MSYYPTRGHEYDGGFGAINTGSPPPYHKAYEAPASRGARWDPRGWSRRMRLIALGIAVILLIILIIAIYYGVHNNSSYPDYAPLAYTLQDTYAGQNFFDQFDYFTGYDPTYGFVHYVPRETAESPQYNLTYANADSAVLKVDTTEQNASTGRFSVRIESKKQYNSGGLFIFDILNTPYGCATWPALWLTDPANWPENGEIDVVEATNKGNQGAHATLHTTKGCNMNARRKQSGKALQASCNHAKNDNAGCGVKSPADAYGAALNSAGGGVYAMEWRDAGIRVWFFPRAAIPADIPEDVSNTTAPDPSTWGEPLADFPSTDCDIGSHFRNQSIVANIDLCGALAGAVDVYSGDYACPGKCSDFVATRPEAFATAFWEWRSWRVYTANS